MIEINEFGKLEEKPEAVGFEFIPKTLDLLKEQRIHLGECMVYMMDVIKEHLTEVEWFNFQHALLGFCFKYDYLMDVIEKHPEILNDL